MRRHTDPDGRVWVVHEEDPLLDQLDAGELALCPVTRETFKASEKKAEKKQGEPKAGQPRGLWG